MAQSFAKLFSNVEQSAAYAASRPTYPDSLYSAIYKFAGLKRYGLAVDVATGTGQAVGPLAAKFDKGIGLDGSSKQLEQATKFPNVEYRECDAHDLKVDTGTADLVTVAQALHWFDFPRFYPEVRRVLAPGGAFAAWTYDLGHLNGEGSAADQALWQLYQGVLGPYWAGPRNLVDQCYSQGVAPGPEHFRTVDRVQLPMDSTHSVATLAGYVRSWSAYTTYRKQHPERQDPLEPFLAQLQAILALPQGTDPDSVQMTLQRKLTIILAKDPVPL